jgi:hypothetical protein
VGVVGLTNKGAVGFNEFLYRRPEAACKGGKGGFVDDPFLGGVIGIIINRDEVIEGFDQFSFRFGGVEVCRCLFLGFLLVSGVGRSLFRSRLRDGSSGRLGWNNRTNNRRGCPSC